MTTTRSQLVRQGSLGSGRTSPPRKQSRSSSRAAQAVRACPKPRCGLPWLLTTNLEDWGPKWRISRKPPKRTISLTMVELSYKWKLHSFISKLICFAYGLTHRCYPPHFAYILRRSSTKNSFTIEMQENDYHVFWANAYYGVPKVASYLSII